MSETISPNGSLREHAAKLKDVDYAKTEARVLAHMAEQRRVAQLIANTEAVNTATGRLGLLCATSRPALRINAGLQRAFKHDALVAAGVFPAKLTGRQMDAA